MKHKSVYGTIRRSIHSLRRLTPSKLANLLRLAYEIKLRRPVVKSKPAFLRINAYPYCNLRCPGCMGDAVSGQLRPRRKEPIMTFEQFKRCVDQMSDSLLRIVLYDEGEPLLHPDIFKMVKHASSRGISVTISSNLSLPMSDKRAEELVMSGLDHLIVAMDGTDQESYARYRVGGSLELVQGNLRRIIEAKRRLGRRRPKVEVQFLDFGYNSHQVPEAREFAKSVGADVFYAFTGTKRDSRDDLLFDGSDRERIRHGCYHLWAVADVTSGGELVPCDFGEDRDMPTVGSLLSSDFNELWNGRDMVNLRKAFGKDSDCLGSEYCRECRLTAAPPPILR